MKVYRSGMTYLDLLIATSLVFAIGVTYVYRTGAVPKQIKDLGCQNNLIHLRQAFMIYSDHSKKYNYPDPAKWCDQLLEFAADTDITIMFNCPAVESSTDGPFLCHYAINPNAMPDSDPDTVLLFETASGWNKFGAAELMSFENHPEKGCCVLFNNGQTDFITPDKIHELKWIDKKY